MPVPAKRRSKSQWRRRRSHAALDIKNLIKCPSCGKMMRPHVACPSCGKYKGRVVVDVMKKAEKKVAKAKARSKVAHDHDHEAEVKEEKAQKKSAKKS